MPHRREERGERVRERREEIGERREGERVKFFKKANSSFEETSSMKENYSRKLVSSRDEFPLKIYIYIFLKNS